MWPRTFVVVLQFIERDNGDLARLFDRIEKVYGDKINELLGEAGVAIGGAAGFWLFGTAGVEAGKELGVYLGEGLKLAHRESARLILAGLSDEIFPPVVLELTIDDPAELKPGSAFSTPRALDLKWPGSTAHYGLHYDWISQ